MSDATLDAPARATLLDVARASIRSGLATGRALAVDARDYPPALRALRASFVTLERAGQLRGCIGTLEARRPLVEDVAANACAAACHDPRFAPLAPEEYDDLALHVSVLGVPERLPCASEAELLTRLRPGIDGLILEDQGRRATFLPSVWEQLPDPRAFVEHLRRKAGLPPGHWSDSLRVWHYTTESFP